MNIIGVTSGNTLEVFYRLLDSLKQEASIDKVGVYVANAAAFKRITQKFSKQGEFKPEYLKEWDISSVATARHKSPDWERVARYEAEIGDPSFWNALVADRRIFFGKYCKYKQDYSAKFSYDEMIAILDEALCRIDDFITRIQPDVIVGFTTATLGDYLFYLFAKARNIPYLLLKSTKIHNFVSFNDTAVGLSGHIHKIYASEGNLSSELQDKSRQFLDSVVSKGVNYEGAILKGRGQIFKKLRAAPVNMLKGLVASIRRRLNAEQRRDNHIPGHFRPTVYQGILQPLKSWAVTYRLRKQFIDQEQLSEIGDYVFYPLHFEPEVSLQVFGRPYQNQIELIRNLAQSVPVGTRILVKEHPRSLGFRPFSYYKKLLDIPNVLLVNPFLPAVEIVRHAKAVAVVSGTIGFEAAICQKPVITFGNALYNALPDSMVRHITDLNALGYELLDLLHNYEYKADALERFVAATIEASVPIDLYTSLLRKKNRHRDTSDAETNLDEEYGKLSAYCMRRIEEVRQHNLINEP